MRECCKCLNDAAPGSSYCLSCQQDQKEHAEKLNQQRLVTLQKVWNGEEKPDWLDLKPPKKYFGAVWDTLTPTIQKQIAPFVAGESDLLTFIGCPGAGKTWAAWATTGAFLTNHDATYFSDHEFRGFHFYTNWYTLNLAARDSRLFGDEGIGNREFLGRLKMCELLIIDEFATARPYEAEFMAVMAVIHHRFDNGLATVLITTKSETELTAILGEAMVSRINSGVVVRMQGRDRRQK